METSQIPNLSLDDPNPVICCSEDGCVDFGNPAAASLLHSMHLTTLVQLLPDNHADLHRKCLLYNRDLSAESAIHQRVFEWRYRPVPKTRTVNIYGHDVTHYVVFESACMSTLNNLQVGIIHVDTDLNIYYINQSAHIILASAGELTIHEGKLSATTPLVINRLRQLTRKTTVQNNNQKTAEVMCLPRGRSMRPLELLITPITCRDVTGLFPQPSVILYLFDRTANTSESENMLKRLSLRVDTQ